MWKLFRFVKIHFLVDRPKFKCFWCSGSHIQQLSVHGTVPYSAFSSVVNPLFYFTGERCSFKLAIKLSRLFASCRPKFHIELNNEILEFKLINYFNFFNNNKKTIIICISTDPAAHLYWDYNTHVEETLIRWWRKANKKSRL